MTRKPVLTVALLFATLFALMWLFGVNSDAQNLADYPDVTQSMAGDR